VSTPDPITIWKAAEIRTPPLALNPQMNALPLRVRNPCVSPSINPSGIPSNLERRSVWRVGKMQSAGRCLGGHIRYRSLTPSIHHQAVTVMQLTYS